MILALRARTTAIYFSSWSSLIAKSQDTALSVLLWRSASLFLIDVIKHLPDEDAMLETHFCRFILELELQIHRMTPEISDNASNPFRISMEPKQYSGGPQEHRQYLLNLSNQENGISRGLAAAAIPIVCPNASKHAHDDFRRSRRGH